MRDGFSRGQIGARQVLGVALVSALMLSGCGLFSDDERLEGERIRLRDLQNREPAAPVEVTRAALPAAQPQGDWTQTGAGPSHNGGNIAGPANPVLAWSVAAGEGASDAAALTSAPIVVGGSVFLLDAEAVVRAFDAGSGAQRWEVSLALEGEDGTDGFGGGLAAADGRLYAATGFGEVIAMNPGSGEILWRKRFEAPFRAAPAADTGLVLAISRDNTAHALSADTGEQVWRHQGVGADAGIVGGASPALVGILALVPYSSGELVALSRATGRRAWTAVITGGRRGLARSAITDLSGDPVVIGNVVIAANQSGRTAAILGQNGERAWTRTLGATSALWAAETSVFMVSDEAQLLRLDARTGTTLWQQQLPPFEDMEDREDPIQYSGPVLVQGRVLVTDSLGNLWSYDGVTAEGGVIAQVPGGSLTGPVAAGGTVYVLSEDGVLHAYR